MPCLWIRQFFKIKAKKIWPSVCVTWCTNPILASPFSVYIWKETIHSVSNDLLRQGTCKMIKTLIQITLLLSLLTACVQQETELIGTYQSAATDLVKKCASMLVKDSKALRRAPFWNRKRILFFISTIEPLSSWGQRNTPKTLSARDTAQRTLFPPKILPTGSNWTCRDLPHQIY